MRATIFRAVPSVLLVFLSAQCFSFAQGRLLSGSRHVGKTLTHKSGAKATPAHVVQSAVQPPPNTTDSWTGLGDGTSWSNASNWNSGVPNSSTTDVIIGTTTANVADNLVNAQIANLTLSHAGDSLTINNGIALDVFGPPLSNRTQGARGSAAHAGAARTS